MSELPSGAVTFLFTDVEGSTRLLKQLRDRYGEVLSEHGRLLRDYSPGQRRAEQSGPERSSELTAIEFHLRTPVY